VDITMIDPGKRFDGPEEFTPVGVEVRAIALGYNATGQLRLKLQAR